MNLTPYLAFSVEFDLRGYPTLNLEDTSAYPAGVAGQKVWWEVKQPDGIKLPYASEKYPEDSLSIPLRLDSLQKHQRGLYEITMYVKYEGDLAKFTRTFEFGYDAVKLDLEREFDVYTPRLRYRDNTDYDVIHFNVTSSVISWQAEVGYNGAIGTKTADTSIFDLAIDTYYYSAHYKISFSRELVYTHQLYSWLQVLDKYTYATETEAYPPPTIAEMVDAMYCLHEHVLQGCGCGCNDEYMERYQYAAALMLHIYLAVIYDRYQGLEVLLEQFKKATGCFKDKVTNLPIPVFVYTETIIESGTADTLEFDVEEPMTTFNTLYIAGHEILSIHLEGIERKWREGTMLDTPADGTFIFDKESGDWKYGGELQPGMWVKIEYKK